MCTWSFIVSYVRQRVDHLLWETIKHKNCSAQQRILHHDTATHENTIKFVRLYCIHGKKVFLNQIFAVIFCFYTHEHTKLS